jgi:hypothetical protein
MSGHSCDPDVVPWWHDVSLERGPVYAPFPHGIPGAAVLKGGRGGVLSVLKSAHCRVSIRMPRARTGTKPRAISTVTSSPSARVDTPNEPDDHPKGSHPTSSRYSPLLRQQTTRTPPPRKICHFRRRVQKHHKSTAQWWLPSPDPDQRAVSQFLVSGTPDIEPASLWLSVENGGFIQPQMAVPDPLPWTICCVI